MKAVVLNLLLIILIAVFSLPLLALYVLIFFGLGGGWACAGPNDCYFVIARLATELLSGRRSHWAAWLGDIFANCHRT